jgi:activating signal cointegrator complex subunit 3
MVLRQNNPLLASRLLEFSLMLDQQLWDFSHPLRQNKILSHEILEKIEKRNISIETLREMSADEIGMMIYHQKMGPVVKRCAEEFPYLDLNVNIQP